MNADALGPRLVSTARVLAWSLRERHAPFRPPATVAAVRDARLRALVRYASEEVPHYRELFSDLGIDPREIRTVDDLRALPLLDKETVQRDTARFRPVSPEREHAVPFPTSGSSGTPLTVFHDPAAMLRYLAVAERERAPMRRLVGARRYRTLVLGHAATAGVRARAYYRRATLLPPRPGRSLVPVDAQPEAIAASVAAERPDVLAGRGNHVEWVFELLATGAISFPLPKAVRYYADTMTAEGRRLIEERFGVPVASVYGAGEAFKIGFTCEERTGFHLHADVCHVRVIRPDGVDAPPGEAGEVVISNLVNRGTVLFNYRLGDVSALVPHACPCGRSLQLMDVVQARVNEMITLRDGTLVHPLLVSAALRLDGLLRFRLVQEATDRFRLEAVTIDDAAHDRLVAALPALEGLLGGARVDVDRRSALDDSPTRKYRRVVALAEDRA